MMRYAFFPGCVLDGVAQEARLATNSIAAALGLELVELPGWTCCGASHLQDVNDTAALAVNARNLALAERLGLPLLTVCNTCTLMLRQAKARLDNGQQESINALLRRAGLMYQGTAEVTHLLWVLARDYGPERLAARIKRPLTGLKVAGYYGCHILRPPQALGFEDYVNPHSLEDVITALGAAPVPFSARLSCCGFHGQYSAPEEVIKITGEINLSARQAGADCLVTPCPLCQMQLDIYQKEGWRAVHATGHVPVLHLSQLVGLALGLPPAELGLERHVTAVAPLIGKI